MYLHSLYSGDIIGAFTRNIPDCYVRDYRGNNGYVTICKGYKDIRWHSSDKEYTMVPAFTLASIPQGTVTAGSKYAGLRLVRPGWIAALRTMSDFATYRQFTRILKELRVGLCHF